jgi:catechol 2,3-dioxygenase-like lactoylglutathione lyase family enzyme
MIRATDQLVFLYTDDLPRAATFYGQVLGLPLAMDQGSCKLFRTSPGAILGVCDLAHRERGTKGITVSFLVEDVDATYAALVAKGVAFEGPPRTAMSGQVRGAFFRDPDGYRLEIQSFTDPGWDRSRAAD